MLAAHTPSKWRLIDPARQGCHSATIIASTPDLCSPCNHPLPPGVLVGLTNASPCRSIRGQFGCNNCESQFRGQHICGPPLPHHYLRRRRRGVPNVGSFRIRQCSARNDGKLVFLLSSRARLGHKNRPSSLAVPSLLFHLPRTSCSREARKSFKPTTL